MWTRLANTHRAGDRPLINTPTCDCVRAHRRIQELETLLAERCDRFSEETTTSVTSPVEMHKNTISADVETTTVVHTAPQLKVQPFENQEETEEQTKAMELLVAAAAKDRAALVASQQQVVELTVANCKLRMERLAAVTQLRKTKAELQEVQSGMGTGTSECELAELGGVGGDASTSPTSSPARSEETSIALPVAGEGDPATSLDDDPFLSPPYGSISTSHPSVTARENVAVEALLCLRNPLVDVRVNARHTAFRDAIASPLVRHTTNAKDLELADAAGPRQEMEHEPSAESLVGSELMDAMGTDDAPEDSIIVDMLEESIDVHMFDEYFGHEQHSDGHQQEAIVTDAITSGLDVASFKTAAIGSATLGGAITIGFGHAQRSALFPAPFQRVRGWAADPLAEQSPGSDISDGYSRPAAPDSPMEDSSSSANASCTYANVAGDERACSLVHAAAQQQQEGGADGKGKGRAGGARHVLGDVTNACTDGGAWEAGAPHDGAGGGADVDACVCGCGRRRGLGFAGVFH